MRFLLDHNISPKGRATDEVVIDFARRERRVLVSADTDFATILARSRAVTPSFILIRRMAHERPAEQAQIILDNLPAVADDLEPGQSSYSVTGHCESVGFRSADSLVIAHRPERAEPRSPGR